MNAFRMIPFQKFDAFTNMALDEAIMEGVRSGDTLPTIRFYGWTPSAISIGIFQGLRNEVNPDAAQAAGIDIVRRQTGGGAVYHDTDGEVTYSLIAPLALFPSSVLESYALICTDIVRALAHLGIKASFAPINDIVVNERKISGNAQTRRNGVLLQHGTILHEVNVEKMFSLLAVPPEKMSDKLVKSVRSRVTCVRDLTDCSITDLCAALEQGFSHKRAIVYGDYTQDERSCAAELASRKYRTDAWNLKL